MRTAARLLCDERPYRLAGRGAGVGQEEHDPRPVGIGRGPEAEARDPVFREQIRGVVPEAGVERIQLAVGGVVRPQFEQPRLGRSRLGGGEPGDGGYRDHG